MTRIITAILCISLSLYVNSSFSQEDQTDFNWKFTEANKLMEESLFNQAAKVWTELVSDNPDNSNLNFKLGYSYFRSYNQKYKALPYLEKAAEKRTSEYGSFNTSGYDPFDPKEVNAPPEVDYYLARAYHLDYQFDKAIIQYKKMYDTAGDKHDLHKPSLRGIEMCESGKILVKDAQDYNIVNLGDNINTEYPDFSPVISVDENTIVYTSRRIRTDSSNFGVIDVFTGLPYEDVYIAFKDRTGQWQKSEMLNIKYDGNLAPINISADGQTLLVYRDDDGDGNIYQSKLIGETWSDLEPLGPSVNSKAWETHAAMSADGSKIYFVSDRKGGMGGRDIWSVVKLPDGEWGKAQPISNDINTQYNEDAPFIHPNGKTLYFASEGHNSMGGFDIFYSELQENGTWSTPANIGYPLNTTDDDVFFVTSADGKRAYFSSDKQQQGVGEKDIYRVDLPDHEIPGLTVLKGAVVAPPGTMLPPSTILYITDKSTGEVTSYKPRQRDGVYVAILDPCTEYNLDYRVDGITIHTEDIYIECETSYQEINKEIYLNPVGITAPATVVDVSTGSDSTGTVSGTEVVVAGGAEVVDGTEDPDPQGSGSAVSSSTYPAQYARYYKYNETDINKDEQDFKKFIDEVIALIQKNGKANVVVESSASKVPTKTYGTNDKLSKARSTDAKDRLIEALTAHGVDASKVYVEAVNSLIQGPDYNYDYRSNRTTYEKFQYVKLRAH